jgi:hypothetical protein
MKPLTSVSAIALTSLIGCYGAAPPKPPRVPLPPLAEGAEIDVRSESRTTIEQVQRQSTTCPNGVGQGSPDCVVTHYTEAEPVTRTTTSATYGAEPITYAQFRVMTDPHWDEKLTALDDLAHKCQRANIPRYAGLGLMLGGLVSGLVVGAAGSKTGEAALMYGGLGAGGASYALGYFAFGGRQCVEARNLYNEMDMSAAMDMTMVDGADHANEMKLLADQFNAAHGGARTAMTMRPEEDVPPPRPRSIRRAVRTTR